MLTENHDSVRNGKSSDFLFGKKKNCQQKHGTIVVTEKEDDNELGNFTEGKKEIVEKASTENGRKSYPENCLELRV